MPSVDFARWTTTLTASYLALTAALIAILGTSVPGRFWLVAVHLALAGSLLILDRASPPEGILRLVRDWHAFRQVFAARRAAKTRTKVKQKRLTKKRAVG